MNFSLTALCVPSLLMLIFLYVKPIFDGKMVILLEGIAL
jgi:hypothetical protein